MRREVEARAGDAGVDADDDWEEPEGEPERLHQPIGTRGYGEKSETLVIMEWRKWRRGGRGSLGGETRRRPPPRHLGFFSFSLGVSGVGAGWLFFWESGSGLVAIGGYAAFGGKRSSESMLLCEGHSNIFA